MWNKTSSLTGPLGSQAVPQTKPTWEHCDVEGDGDVVLETLGCLLGHLQQAGDRDDRPLPCICCRNSVTLFDVGNGCQEIDYLPLYKRHSER